MRFHLFHNWQEWQDLKEYRAYGGYIYRQTRVCVICNKRQIREI